MRRGLIGVLAFLFAIIGARSASAVPFVAGDVLRVTFDLTSGLAGNPPAVNDGAGHYFAIPGQGDTFGVSVLVKNGSGVNTFTARLYDGDRLLGTSTIPAAPLLGNPFGRYASFYFTSASSLLTGRTVIDFSSLQNGSIDGAVEFTMDAGQLDLRNQHAMELFLGHAVSPGLVYGWSVRPHGESATPEPASLLLIGSGLGALALRFRRRK